MIAAIGRYLWARIFSGRKAISCREATDFLMAYLDGELPEPVRVEFELHLGVCQACRAFLETYKDTIRMSREAMCGDEAPAMPEELTGAILAAVRRERPK